jgi:D-serine deaminase-like pyridoxal phosphate-dependent protein
VSQNCSSTDCAQAGVADVIVANPPQSRSRSKVRALASSKGKGKARRMLERNKAVVRGYVAAFNSGDMAALRAIFVKDVKI